MWTNIYEYSIDTTEYRSYLYINARNQNKTINLYITIYKLRYINI